jgi:hypothetical protein
MIPDLAFTEDDRLLAAALLEANRQQHRRRASLENLVQVIEHRSFPPAAPMPKLDDTGDWIVAVWGELAHADRRAVASVVRSALARSR